MSRDCIYFTLNKNNCLQVKVRSDFFSEVPILALTPHSAPNSEKVRTKSVPAAFSARQSVSDNNGHSVYLPTLSERLDHAEKAENGHDRYCETPKRVSFSVGFDEAATNGKEASK